MRMQKKQIIALTLGLLAFVGGPIFGIISIMFFISQRNQLSGEQKWPFYIALILSLIGFIVYLIISMMVLYVI